MRPVHELHDELARLQDLLRRRDGHAHPGERAVVRAEVKARRDGHGGWRLTRFSWSTQERDVAATPSFRARTLLYRADGRETVLHHFPDDPGLPGMARYFGATAPRDAVSVLRYVPLRRLTFCRMLPDAPWPVIGKFTRASKVRASYERLVAVHRTVHAVDPGFAVATPAGVDETASVYYQQLMHGVDLATCVRPENVAAVMADVGAIHAELHRLDVPGLPTWSFTHHRNTLDDDVEWIAFAAPHAGPLARRLWRRLAACVPAVRDDRFTLCHGDFVPSHLLVGGPRPVVTDFDLAHRGEPAREVGRLLASLKYDVPLFRSAFEAGDARGRELLARAEAAYSAGYAAAGRIPPDSQTVAWFRACAELQGVARLLRKEWFRPSLVSRALANLEPVEHRLAR